MDVGSASMNLSIAQTVNSAALAMTKNVMELTEQQSAALIEMVETATPPTDTIAINMRV